MCGDLEIAVDVQGGWSGALTYEQDVLKVYTSDLTLAGQTMNVLIYPTLLDYPTQKFRTPTVDYVASSLAVELPITLEECIVT